MIESPPAPPRSAAAGSRRPRVALAHDWLCGKRGGEAVLERLAALVEREFEPAGLFVMFDDGRALTPIVDAWRARGLVRASMVNSLPGARRLRRWMMPLYPAAVGDLSARVAREHARAPIDLVISTSSAAIKGLATAAPHLCYCFAPARYVWSVGDEYGGDGLKGMLRSAGLAAIRPLYTRWDRATAGNVTQFVTLSTHVQERIRTCFGRESLLVAPPCNTAFYTPDAGVARERFWLVVSAIEPYKRVDLAIAAAEMAGVELVVAGEGSQRRALQARSGRVTFLGRVSDERLRELYRSARVLIFPQVEDFGIVAVEALACGLPVVARRAGGALDIVREGVTGAMFDEPTPRAIVEAVERLPRDCSGACRADAERFAEPVFDAAMLGHIRAMLHVPSPAAQGGFA